jgi:hypothetical protein
VALPILLPVGLAVIGGIVAGGSGLVVAFGLGLLIDVAIIVGAATWARQIGSLLEADDAWANAPRPPGFRGLVEWVYERTLPKSE